MALNGMHQNLTLDELRNSLLGNIFNFREETNLSKSKFVATSKLATILTYETKDSEKQKQTRIDN